MQTQQQDQQPQVQLQQPALVSNQQVVQPNGPQFQKPRKVSYKKVSNTRDPQNPPAPEEGYDWLWSTNCQQWRRRAKGMTEKFQQNIANARSKKKTINQTVIQGQQQVTSTMDQIQQEINNIKQQTQKMSTETQDHKKSLSEELEMLKKQLEEFKNIPQQTAKIAEQQISKNINMGFDEIKREFKRSGSAQQRNGFLQSFGFQ